jgi:M6 family metalloprotease-like protein
MTIMKKLLAILLSLFLSVSLMAAWLDNVPQTITQPNGEVIHCYASGDEFYHWLHDKEGYTIVQNPQDGYFYYGERKGEGVAPTSHKVGSIDPASAGLEKNVRISNRLYQERRAQYEPNLKSLKDAPTTGQVNNIAIYISFADDSLFTRTRGYFYDFYSSEEGPSLKDYYREVSYNRLFVDTYHFPESPDTIHISYVDIHPRSYYLKYSASNPNGYRDNQSASREHALLERACNFIEDQLPDSVDFDANDDGNIDNVCFVIQGPSAGWSDLLWPHRWSLYTRDVRLKGKRVRDYLLMLENGFNVGTLCHEFFHVLGAPDLYHYNDTGAPVACGGWDIMDSSHDPPQYMGAFMKYKYGDWMASIPEITESGTYTLYSLQHPDQNIYKIKSPLSQSEYFVLEYRKREGQYDGNAPGTGLVFYRINPNAGRGNAQGPPDEVYVYRPKGTLSENGSLGSAAFGGNSRKTFNDKTDPSSFLYNNGNGGRGGLDVFAISDPGGDSISFQVNIIPFYPPGELSYELNDGIVTLDWEPTIAEGFRRYNIYRNGERVHSTTRTYWSDPNTEEGLSYYYSVTAYYEGEKTGESDPTNEVIVTPLGVLSIPYYQDFELAEHGWIFRNSIEGFRRGSAEELEMEMDDNPTILLGANSVVAGKNTHTIDMATSPRLDLSGASSVSLTFDYSLKRWQRLDHLTLFYKRFPDDDWNLILDMPVSGYGMGYKWRTFEIDLPEEALTSEMQIGFQYDDSEGFGFGAAIDNIIVKDPASGSEDVLLEELIKVYPNPVRSVLNIDISLKEKSDIRLHLITQTGQILKSYQYSDTSTLRPEINVESLPTGLYFLMIEMNKQTVFRKIIRQ